MKPILNIYSFLPVILLMVQTFIFLIGTLGVLRYLKILRVPYAGMEYPKVLIAAVMLFSVLIISAADAEGIVQSIKTFHDYGDGFGRNLLIKFSQFLLVIVLTIAVFSLACFIVIRAIPSFRYSFATGDDMPGAVMQSVVFIIIAILLYSCVKGIMGEITPKYINFT